MWYRFWMYNKEAEYLKMILHGVHTMESYNLKL